MTGNEFAQLCDKSFFQIYAKAKETSEVQFLTSCFAFYKEFNHDIMSYITDYEFHETLDLINQFKRLQDDRIYPKQSFAMNFLMFMMKLLFRIKSIDEVDVKIKTRVRLLLYCHIIEVDIIYMILFNMLRTIKGEQYSPTITFKSKNKCKSGGVIEAEYPSQKIEQIEKESQAIGIPLQPIYSEFYFNHLRNAFSHSQYFLDQDGGFNLSKNLSPATSAVYKKATKNNYFKAEEIQAIFDKIILYIESFIRNHMQFLERYADGGHYQTNFGRIYYSQQYGWGFVQNQKQ